MSRRRQELLELLDRRNPMIDELSKAIEQEAEGRPEVQPLMTHPGVGTSLTCHSTSAAAVCRSQEEIFLKEIRL